METKKYLKLNDNENTSKQNLWDAGKAVLGGKVTVLNLCQKSYKNINLSVQLKKIKQSKLKISEKGNNKNESRKQRNGKQIENINKAKTNKQKSPRSSLKELTNMINIQVDWSRENRQHKLSRLRIKKGISGWVVKILNG